MGRLIDGEKQFGPITYGHTLRWKPLIFKLSSGGDTDDDEETKCNLIVYMFGYVFRIFLGNLITPVKYKVKTSWKPDVVERMGRNWYYAYFKKEYGFRLNEGYLHILYGFQNEMGHYTHVDNEGYVTYSPREPNKIYKKLEVKHWSMLLPWAENRHTRYTLYSKPGVIFFETKDNNGVKFNTHYEKSKECPIVSFILKDYDGELVTAKTFIEEREYKKGAGKFKWLSFFIKPLIVRSLNIEFDKETGKEKGSYKGGTIGTSIKIDSNTYHEEGIKQFCLKEHSSKSGKYLMDFVNQI